MMSLMKANSLMTVKFFFLFLVFQRIKDVVRMTDARKVVIDVVIIMRKQVLLHHRVLILMHVMLVTMIWHQSKKSFILILLNTLNKFFF